MYDYKYMFYLFDANVEKKFICRYFFYVHFMCI